MSGDNWSARIVVAGRRRQRTPVRLLEPRQPALLRNRRDAAPARPGVRPARSRRVAARRDRVAVVRPNGISATPIPIGRRIGQTVPEIEIVGVVGDAKYQDGRRRRARCSSCHTCRKPPRAAPAPSQMGVKLDRSHYPQAIEIQTDRRRAGLESDVRRAMADVDRRITVRSMLTMDEQVAGAFNLDRLIARLTGAFGAGRGVARVPGAVRRHRLLGDPSHPRDRRPHGGRRVAWPRVVATVVRGAWCRWLIGAAIGLPAALFAGRSCSAAVRHQPVRSPALAAGVALLGLSAAIAALIPPAAPRAWILSERCASTDRRASATGAVARGDGSHRDWSRAGSGCRPP